MKTKILLFIVLGCLASAGAMAQCSVQIVYQQNPNSPTTTLWADSIAGGSGATTYSWSFGDGTGGTGIQVSHDFPNNGVVVVYFVCLTMTDAASNCNFTTCDSVVVPGPATGGCSAYISYTNADSLYSFAVIATGAAPFTYQWFEDGQSAGTDSTVDLVIDSITNGNSAEVCVLVTDSAGCSATSCERVSNGTPAGCNIYLTYTHQDSLYTFFTANTGNIPAVYQWFFANAPLPDTTSSITLIIDSFPVGAYLGVCVNVTTANGYTCNDCVDLSNSGGGGGIPCQAYFVIYPDSANGAQGYYYGYNVSTGNYNQNVLWDFGDGTTSTDPFPVHQYAAPGQYIVCLTVGVAGTSCYDTYCDSSFYVFKTEGGLMSHLEILGPTGITESTANAAVRIYPNPVSNELNIESPENVELVRIFALSGQRVLESRLVRGKINVSKLPAGIYAAELISGNRTSRVKLIKE